MSNEIHGKTERSMRRILEDFDPTDQILILKNNIEHTAQERMNYLLEDSPFPAEYLKVLSGAFQNVYEDWKDGLLEDILKTLECEIEDALEIFVNRINERGGLVLESIGFFKREK